MTADPIEGFLDQLLTHLRGSAQDVRRILSEVEEHLRDVTAELVAAGTSKEEAQRLAIERFGHPRTVARRFSARLTRSRRLRSQPSSPGPRCCWARSAWSRSAPAAP